MFKRYIYRNGKKYGPYYYHNTKINGKVISNYVGTEEDRIQTKKKHNVKIAIIVISVIAIFLFIYVASFLKLFPTGRQIDTPSITTTAPEPNQVDFSHTEQVKPIEDKTVEESKYKINTVQSPVIVNNPVQWKKEISLETEGSIKISIPKESENIAVYKINVNGDREKLLEPQIKITARASSEIITDKSQIQESKIVSFFKKIFNFLTGKVINIQESQTAKEITINEKEKQYEIEYSTLAPYTIETKIERGKSIKLINPSEIDYKDVLISSNIEELRISNPSSISLYSIEKNQVMNYENIEDKNDDGIYDYLEFISPDSSNQTFEIIVITKAEHLDENRTFISDIYGQVKELDNIWSETISNGEYVRVTFEQNLTSTNDITIFPRITEGNPKIEIYEKDKNNLIAEFTNLNSGIYNKVYLTNLQGEQDTFDLKIIGGNVEFDHIVDPVFSFSGSRDIGLAPIDNQTFILTYIDSSTNNLIFLIQYTNGTIKAGPFTADNAIGANTRVSITMINSTHFVLGWTEANLQDELRAIYTINGALVSGPLTTDGALGTQYYDTCVAEMGNRFMYFYTDATEGDADLMYYLNNNVLTVSEINVDATMSPNLNSANLLDCSTITSTRAVVFWYDRGSSVNDATYRIVSETGATIVADTDIDADIGTSGGVATASISGDRFVLAWYDRTDQDITLAMRYTNNTIITTPFDLDIVAGTSSRLDVSAVGNGTNPDNFVVVWYNQVSNTIKGQSFNRFGSSISLPYTIETSPSTTLPLIEVIGKDSKAGLSLCPDKFVVAYTNSTGTSIFKSYYINGTLWDGNCQPQIADIIGPTISNPNTNTSLINQNEFFCLNATAIDISGVSSIRAEVYNTTHWLNYTMNDTGTICGGLTGDNIYGVSIQGSSIGLWNYSKVYANDTLNNWNSYDFSDLTINVTQTSNQPPQIIYVQQPLLAVPLESTFRTINFEVHISDANGADDIDDNSIRVDFSKLGDLTRSGTCKREKDLLNPTTANYTCFVDMFYYDSPGFWNISIRAGDFLGDSGINDTNLFRYQELKAIVINSPSGALTWPTLKTGDASVLSNNDPLVINNTGNFVGPIYVTATNLAGETNPTESLSASDFRAGSTSGSECGATQLQNSLTQVLGSNLIIGPTAQEEIYFCIASVPQISSQNYSTSSSSSWTISI